MFISLNKRPKENVQEEKITYRSFDFSKRSERDCDFSLELRAIRLSDFFGARSKAALRRETYERAPILKSFDKLREVGVSSYLFYS